MITGRWVAGVLVASGCWAAAPAPRQPPRAPAPPMSPAQPPTTAPPVARIQPPDTLDPGIRAAMAALDAVDEFALGPVGIMATPNLGETITLQLAQRPDAVEAFAWLADHGGPIARLYAYWALRTLAPSRAAAYTSALADDAEIVETAAGCRISQTTVRSIEARMHNPNDLVGRAMPAP